MGHRGRLNHMQGGFRVDTLQAAPAPVVVASGEMACEIPGGALAAGVISDLFGSGDFLARLRAANVARRDRWHAEMTPWGGTDWACAMGGEAGEALNVVKKLRRRETDLNPNVESGHWEADGEYLIDNLADELADTIIYADLLAEYYGIDLHKAIVEKFNRKSVENGFPERLGVSE